MATAPNQGIMALPENQAMQAPPLSLMDSYDAMQQGLQTARPDAAMELEEALAEIRPELDELSDEELGLLIQGVEGLYGDPENYAKEVADLVAEDLVDEGDFPAEYDEEFLAAFLMVLIDTQRSRMASAGASQTMPMPESSLGMAPMGMAPPQGFARGGIAEAARMVANSGRNGDTMLAHITPEEARLLMARGGSGTINPETGLPEFFLKKIFKAVTQPFKAVAKVVKQTVKNVGKVVKKVLSSPVGRILGTIALGMVMGPAVMAMFPSLAATVGGVTSLTAMGSAVTGALASGTAAALSGGDLKSVLTSAATGFLGAPGGPVGNFIGKYTAAVGVTNAAANAALTGAIVGTGSGLVSGQSLKESLKSGLVEGAISGGTAFMSGAPKVDVDNAATTAARDAVESGRVLPDVDSKALDVETQNTVNKFKNVDQPVIKGPAAQPIKAGATPKYLLQPDGSAIDAFTGQSVSADQVKQLGLGPKPYIEVEPSKGIFAQKPGMSPSEFASQKLTTAKERIFAPRPELDMEYSSANLPPPPTPSLLNKAGNFYDEYVSPGVSKVKEFYNEYISPSGIEKAGMADAEKAYADAMARTGGNKELAMKAYNAAMPGVLSTYGPITATGIGALALTGGFEQKRPPPSEFTQQMRQPIDLSGDPSRYYVQNLPGVQYDERGNIIGSTPWSAPQTMKDVRVAGRSYVGYNPMSYRPTPMSYQPAPYEPMLMNNGGIAALAQGGYPRRNGQISGPGTEKSDSIPAMLSDGEFVMTAKAVRGAGGGNRREGAKRMYALMNQLERNAARG